MIDLTRSLPNTISVGGELFSIKTDFKTWLRFFSDMKHKKYNFDVSYIFVSDMPIKCDIIRDLLPFASPKSDLPRRFGETDDEILIDYEIDADLIYAAFMGQYGIDLVEEKELHWHKFLALLRGINKNTKLLEVMQARAYKKMDRKDYDPYEEMKKAWRIEPELTEEEQKEIDEFSALFT